MEYMYFKCILCDFVYLNGFVNLLQIYRNEFSLYFFKNILKKSLE
jgi:hypothetical protein